MENMLRVHIDVDHLILLDYFVGNVVLDRTDIMVDEQLVAVDVPGKSANPVIDRHNVRFEGVDQVIQRL
ncbi:hypothetical protein D3C81_1403720 [compost metagenome]